MNSLFLPFCPYLRITFVYKIDSENISKEERLSGEMRRQLTVTARYYFGEKIHTKTVTKNLVVRLNTERIVRRVGHLGNIIGLSPKRKGSYL